MLEGQNLSGQLSDWSISDLLQIMQVTKKTGSLDIEGERRGRIHFVDGAVTGAELSGEKGSYGGSDAAAIADILYVLSTVDSGSFGLGPADGPDNQGIAVEDVMADVESLRTLEADLGEGGLLEASGLQLVRELDKPMSLEPEDWQAFATLVQPFTFEFLENRVGRGSAVRIIHTLQRLGVVEAAEIDDESTWFDKLAVGVSSGSEPLWLEELGGDSGRHEADPDEAPTEPVEEEPVPLAIVEAPDAEADDDAEPETTPDVDEDVVLVGPTRESVGIAAPASTTLTDGVYDEIRRLRSKAAEK